MKYITSGIHSLVDRYSALRRGEYFYAIVLKIDIFNQKQKDK